MFCVYDSCYDFLNSVLGSVPSDIFLVWKCAFVWCTYVLICVVHYVTVTGSDVKFYLEVDKRRIIRRVIWHGMVRVRGVMWRSPQTRPNGERTRRTANPCRTFICFRRSFKRLTGLLFLLTFPTFSRNPSLTALDPL